MRISQICLSNAAFIIKIINDPYRIRPHQKTIARTEILKDLTEPTPTLSGYRNAGNLCAYHGGKFFGDLPRPSATAQARRLLLLSAAHNLSSALLSPFTVSDDGRRGADKQLFPPSPPIASHRID